MDQEYLLKIQRLQTQLNTLRLYGGTKQALDLFLPVIRELKAELTIKDLLNFLEEIGFTSVEIDYLFKNL